MRELKILVSLQEGKSVNYKSLRITKDTISIIEDLYNHYKKSKTLKFMDLKYVLPHEEFKSNLMNSGVVDFSIERLNSYFKESSVILGIHFTNNEDVDTITYMDCDRDMIQNFIRKGYPSIEYENNIFKYSIIVLDRIENLNKEYVVSNSIGDLNEVLNGIDRG